MMRSKLLSGSGTRSRGFHYSNLASYYSGFQVDCPSGKLRKNQVLDLYSMLMPDGDASVFVDQIFRIFDRDGNGSIDFKLSFLTLEKSF